MKIVIKTIDHSEQKYPTVGNYGKDKDGSKWIEVSDMKNPDYEFLVALHELVEQHLCEKRGIRDEDITSFDVQFENLREANPHIIGDQEPGDMVSAPYYEEHQIATSIERRVAAELGVNWKEYNDAVASL